MEQQPNNEEDKKEDKKDEEEKDLVEDKEEENIDFHGDKSINDLRLKFYKESTSPVHDSKMYGEHWEKQDDGERNEEIEKYMHNSKEFRLYRKANPEVEGKYLIYSHIKNGKAYELNLLS